MGKITEDVARLANMTSEDWRELGRKAELLTEEERQQFAEYVDTGDMTMEEYIEAMHAFPLDELDDHLKGFDDLLSK